jgi:hypothetical protein
MYAPVSPVKFRAAGAPGRSVIFEIADGRVRSATVWQDDRLITTLTPKK